VASGRLVYQKGYGILLRAFSELLQHMPGKLIILGAGDQTALRVLADKLGIAGHTTFAGHVNNVGEYLRQASVFVCSSRYESASCAIQEALSYGLPVVSTDCPNGPSEILDGGRYGLLVAPDEPTALAEAMMRAARGGAPSSFDERRAYIASQFQADAAAAAYKAVFDAIR
jgi:glycosyltransferase involved in cell wall biosynthesis